MNPLAHAVASALVDFVWQGTLVALPLAVSLRCLERRSAQVRYALSAATLLVLVALPVVTTARHLNATAAPDPTAAIVRSSSTVPQTENPALTRSVDAPRDVASILASIEPWVLPVWSLGVLILSGRLVVGGLQVHTLRRNGQQADADLFERVSRLAMRMAIRRPIRLAISEHVNGPSAIGWLRPLILLPPATAMGLTAEQLEAVLAHELAHIRRHDYLVNILQMMAETLLFYHPVVWWVSNRLRVERELCCDDEAVRVCGDATVYARALVTLSKRQVAPMAMGVTGDSLSHRIQALLGLHVREARRSTTLPVIVVAIVVSSMTFATMSGQTERARFEVASVKPSPPDVQRPGYVAFLPGGVVRGTGVSLFLIVTRAYNLSWKQLAGESDLLKERFDIDARADVRALPAEGPTIEQTILRQSPVLREMLQTLLIERFKLAIRVERRDSPVYALVLGRNGHKLTAAAKDCSPGSVVEAASGSSPCGFQGGGPARGLRLRNAELSSLAGALMPFLDRSVIDRTGIQERFDIDLPSWSTGAPPGERAADLVQEPQPDPNDPSIFTLVQERLGLRLESTRAPIDMYVIDHVERPAPN